MKIDFNRLIKVIVKNFAKIHLNYFLLFLKNNKKNGKRIKINDIFIVTSCVNTNESSSYFNHNIEHTSELRLAETITGLESIRRFYPKAYIIFIESSKLSNSQGNLVTKYIDKLYDYCESKNIKLARRHYNKGVPQFKALIKFIEENGHNYYAKTFHFLGARYILTGNVADEYTNLGSYFLYFDKANNVSTRYFFVKGVDLYKLIKPFRRTLYFSIFGNSVEDIIHGYMPNINIVNRLMVSGIVNGVEKIEE